MKIIDFSLEIAITTHDFPTPNLLCSCWCYWIPKPINKLINAHYVSVTAFAIPLMHKARKSNQVEIEDTMKQVITLFRTNGVNPETVLVRRHNKPQRVLLQCFPWIAMGTTCNYNIPCPQVNLFDKTEIDSRRHRDQTCGHLEAGKGWRGSLTLADANFNMQDEQTIRSYCRAQRTISSLLK